MLKNFKNLKGAQVLSKNEQKAVNGGDRPRGGESVCEIGYTYVCGYTTGSWCSIWLCRCEKNPDYDPCAHIFGGCITE